MSISVQRWRPDTCDCVVDELHDPATPGFGVQFQAVVSKCVHHQGVADAALYGVLHSNPDGENKRKNRVFGQYLTISTITATDPSSGVVTLKNGVTFNWSYSGADGGRVLTVSITGAALTTQQKNQVQNFCDSTFGAGRVVVQ